MQTATTVSWNGVDIGGLTHTQGFAFRCQHCTIWLSVIDMMQSTHTYAHAHAHSLYISNSLSPYSIYIFAVVCTCTRMWRRKKTSASAPGNG